MLEQLSRGTALGVSIVLVAASWFKATDVAASRTTLLQLFPGLRRQRSATVMRVIALVAISEALVAGSLLIAPTSALTAALYGCAAMCFLVINVRAFRRQVACGCFGGRSRAQSRRATVVRAALMCGAAPIVALGTVGESSFASLRITRSTLLIAVLMCAIVSVNELLVRGRSVLPATQLARCGRRVRLPVLERLGRELRQSLAPDAIRHADLAWWAAEVSRLPQNPAAPRVFVVAVPGSGGRLNAVVNEYGSSNLLLLTPGGPIAGMSARIDNSIDTPSTARTRFR